VAARFGIGERFGILAFALGAEEHLDAVDAQPPYLECPRQDVEAARYGVVRRIVPVGGPYRRKDAVFESTTVESPFASVFGAQLDNVGGVAVSQVVVDQSDPERRYMPGHPDADKDGYVAFPKINTAEDMVDLISSAAAHENVDVFHRFALMRHWHDIDGMPFEAFLSPDGLHMNDWSYNCFAKALADAIADAATPRESSNASGNAPTGETR